VADIGNDSLDEIIQGCLRKKEKSQEMLYKRFFGYALKVALIHNRNRDNALEIVNDSFVKIFNQIGRYDTSLPFKSWLSKIVINTSIDKFRKNNRNINYNVQETFLVPDDSPGIVTQLTAEDILKLLNHLPEIQRMVFSLYEIEGYSHDEISSLLRIPGNTSRVYLTRAKKRLRELFQLYFNNSYGKFGN
jgi:RNA polymerase sigma-70 factor (ECF subfamily)